MQQQPPQLQFLQCVGEGTFGRVLLAQDLQTKRLLAVKVVAQQPQNQDRLKTELLIHRHLQHPHIIRLLDVYQLPTECWMLMEYAAGGELFDKIQPDIGVDEELAHFYFRQLLNGCAYLHQHGVAHRDLKPENLLLDELGNLKIADFGLATLFLYKGQKRRLTTICGTKPYVAPEVAFGDYDGEMVDIWACGINQYMIDTPWDEASERSEEFCQFCTSENIFTIAPWSRIPASIQPLLKGILHIFEGQRPGINQIMAHPWFKRRNCMDGLNQCQSAGNTTEVDPATLAERFMSRLSMDVDVCSQMNIDNRLSQMQVDVGPFCGTQQTMTTAGMMNASQDESFEDGLAFSQPVQLAQARITGCHNIVSFSQPTESRSIISATPGNNDLVRLAHSLTRFYSIKPPADIVKRLSSILDDFLVSKSISTEGDVELIVFSTVDRRKCPLTGEIRIQPIGPNTASSAHDTASTWMPNTSCSTESPHLMLVHFRKSRGDPLEFKRFYQAIRAETNDLILRDDADIFEPSVHHVNSAEEDMAIAEDPLMMMH